MINPRKLPCPPLGMALTLAVGSLQADPSPAVAQVQARQYLLKASKAAPRPGREVADAGRRAEIAGLLAATDEKLGRE